MEKINDGNDSEVAHHESAAIDLPLRRSTDSATREAIGGASVDDLPPNYYKSVSYIATFISFALSYQGAFMGYVMAANSLSIINADIGPSQDIIWVLLVYVLCQTITYTIVGRMSDLFGRRWYYIGGNLFALVGYLISSRAHTVNVLIGGSVLSGFGSGIQQSMAVVSGELVPNRHRYLALGITFAFLAPLSTISPGLARVFCVKTEQGWRWVYYLMVIISGLAALLQIFFYFPPEFKQLHKHSSKRNTLKGLDYGGLVIFIGSFTSLLLGISWGGQKYPWQSYRVITTIVVGGVGLIAFVFYEMFAGVRHPLVPMYLFRNRNYVALTVVCSVGSMIFYALNIVYPTQLSALFGATPNQTGWLSCTITAGAVAGQFCASFSGFVPKIKFKWQLIICCCIFTAFTGGSAAVTHSTKGMAIVFSLISGLTIGYMEVLALAGGPMMLDPKDIGLACGVQYTIRSGLSVLADSIYVTILENKLKINLPRYIAPAAVQAGLPKTSLVGLLTAVAGGNTTALELVPGITPAILVEVAAATLTAYEKSFKVIYLASLAFGACAILAAFSVVSDQHDGMITSEIARKLQGVKGEAPDGKDEMA